MVVLLAGFPTQSALVADYSNSIDLTYVAGSAEKVSFQLRYVCHR
jgi:hypothetical protein